MGMFDTHCVQVQLHNLLQHELDIDTTIQYQGGKNLGASGAMLPPLI